MPAETEYTLVVGTTTKGNLMSKFEQSLRREYTKLCDAVEQTEATMKSVGLERHSQVREWHTPRLQRLDRAISALANRSARRA